MMIDEICGIDEAGRGPLAGPVCAASVVLSPSFPLAILNDSKKLTEKKRDSAAEIIKSEALAYGIAWASHEEIDALNILRASLLAMSRAFSAMIDHAAGQKLNITQIIIDGLHAPDLRNAASFGSEIVTLVKADTKVHAVMAASILAKTERDREMCRLAEIYSEYRYEKHKGYPTKEHAALIRQYGPSPIQRLTFRIPG
jgi:ribonuclease HII